MLSRLVERSKYISFIVGTRICKRIFFLSEDLSIFFGKCANFCARRSVPKDRLKAVDKKVLNKLLGADIEVVKDDYDMKIMSSDELIDELKEAKEIVVRLYKSLVKIHTHYSRSEKDEMENTFIALGFYKENVPINNEYTKKDTTK